MYLYFMLFNLLLVHYIANYYRFPLIWILSWDIQKICAFSARKLHISNGWKYFFNFFCILICSQTYILVGGKEMERIDTFLVSLWTNFWNWSFLAGKTGFMERAHPGWSEKNIFSREIHFCLYIQLLRPVEENFPKNDVP